MVRLIESAVEACYMFQISSQSDELRRKKKGGPIDPPPPSRLRVTIFSSRFLGLMSFFVFIGP